MRFLRQHYRRKPLIKQIMISLLQFRAAFVGALLIAICIFFCTAPAQAAPPVSQTQASGQTNVSSASGEDTGKNALSWPSAVRFVGKFHVLIIHFPIALLVVAALADGIYLILRTQSFAFASSLCLYIGAPAAVVAAGLGWAAASMGNYTEALQNVVELHRWLGTITAGWAILALAFNVLSNRSTQFSVSAAYRILLYGGSVLVGVTAHFGGTLIYGADYLTR